jgi:signal transduction histidine kinase
VAELVARGAPPPAVFAAVTEEASRLLGGQATTLVRFDGEHELVVVASHGGPAPVGDRIAFEPGTQPDRVRRRAAVDRVDDYAPERDIDLARRYGLAASVSAPITLAGAVWGTVTATSAAGPLPPDTDRRLDAFAQLVAAAVGNAQARAELRALADEQAALRRLAELVARGAAPPEVFVAVAAEASALLGDLATELLWFEGDEAVAVAACNSRVPLGLRIPSHPGTPTGRVLHTGAPQRADTFEGTPFAELARQVGLVAGVAVPVVVGGRVLAALTASSSGPPLPAGVEVRLAQFAELAAVAIANAETGSKLTASRARVVATADETRRRLQRDVHDGAQQRLVHAVIALRLARGAAEDGCAAATHIDEALTNVERAGRELRDVVHGILPRSLTHGGLRMGVESLAADLPVPVDVRVSTPRLSATTETTAYFVIAEALTNAVKHARAHELGVSVDLDGDTLVVEVRDDGVGGADPARGTGLTGLLDRVDAVGGTLTITGPAGRGTVVRAELAVGPDGRRTSVPDAAPEP